MAVQLISARPTINGFIGIRSLQGQTVLHQVVQGNGFIGELEGEISIFLTHEIIGYLDGITTVVTEQNQVVSLLAELHFSRFDTIEAESLITLIIQHIIRTVSLGKHIGIVPRTAVEFVVARTADQGIVTVVAVYPIIATACMDQAA